MPPYPIMLQLSGKQAVVIGGGAVALRKVIHLLEANAKVTVVSPALDPKLYTYYQVGKIHWIKREFQPLDLANAFIVIAATNQKEVNQRVSKCVSEGQLLNVVDQQDLGNFHVPAKLSRGDLTITVSTNGTSPYLAKTIRNEIGKMYGQSMEEYLDFLSRARQTVKDHVTDIEQRKKLLKEITHKDYRNSAEKQKDFLEKVSESNE
ncbi:NAD(P)-binding protein [Lederbergia ruris]|uniref:precorrin-2 dehydrogenase n=1 Tax=Lederbergia ruris TaxID=217495 RepID=A0ABQ4KF73_9BACI|nr:NAD(P)-binding protein [Lederbergia ruris]GIN56622.1 precorrin-2 dehydrogenase [Lederbergia ruris]